MTEIILQGHFSTADQAANEFPLLPFDVPPGIARLHVRYQVSHQLDGSKIGWKKGNIVDIGIFDPRGTEFLTAQGFRGWSGTARTEFTIAATTDETTPGYLAGPVQAGTWHVVLGLYQIAPDGCDYRVVIKMEGGTRKQGDKGARRQGDKGAGGVGARWYRGDLHTHTWHSDGSAPLGDLTAAARAQGLDFCAVTEHNTLSHLPLLDAHSAPDLLLIPGVEITTYHGHANVWPVGWPDDGFVEFRCWTDEQLAQVRESARARGMLFSVNHPKESGPPWAFGESLAFRNGHSDGTLFEPDCIEVWGGPWVLYNHQSLAVWEAQLRQGKRIVAVGGSDKHQGPFTGELEWYDIGTPCTWVYADGFSTEAIIAGIRAGRVFISEGANGPRIELAAEEIGGGQRAVMGGELRLPSGAEVCVRCRVQGGAGNLLRLVSDRDVYEAEITGDDFCHEQQIVAGKSAYWRAEVVETPEMLADDGTVLFMVKALSNPIYILRA